MKSIRVIIKSKTTAVVLAVTAIFVILCCVNPAQAQETGILNNFKKGEKLPPIQLPSLRDMSPQLFTPGGKPSVIMFFSVRPDFRKQRSLALLSALSELVAQYKTKIDVVGIYSDNQMADMVKEYMDKSAINVRIYNDGRKDVHNKYGVFMMPLVILADAEGRLHEVIPYTYNIQKIVEGNIKLLLGEWDKAQLTDSLAPKEYTVKSEQEKEYIRRVNYGRTMLSKKMHGPAIREFSTAMKLMPQMTEAHLGLGFALFETEKYDEAEKSFREALKINAESDEAVSGLGLVFYRKGEYDAAFIELEKAFIVPDPRLDVIIALAELYEKKGSYDKASRYYKLAVSKLMTLYEQRWK